VLLWHKTNTSRKKKLVGVKYAHLLTMWGVIYCNIMTLYKLVSVRRGVDQEMPILLVSILQVSMGMTGIDLSAVVGQDIESLVLISDIRQHRNMT
jgi:hypothetical protein